MGVVRLLERFLGVRSEDREHGPEDLSCAMPIALRDVVKTVGTNQYPSPAAGTRLVDLSALLLAGFDQLANLLELLLRVDRADVGVLVQ